jgi:hypothetical protein
MPLSPALFLSGLLLCFGRVAIVDGQRQFTMLNLATGHTGWRLLSGAGIAPGDRSGDGTNSHVMLSCTTPPMAAQFCARQYQAGGWRWHIVEHSARMLVATEEMIKAARHVQHRRFVLLAVARGQ